jgi:hypothetical protein
MLWRVLITTSAWLVGIGLNLSDGQSFRNAIVVLVGAFVGCAPWIPLLFRERGTRYRRAAIIIVSLSVLAGALIAIDLPREYEFQKRFNEAHRRR